MSGSGMFDLVGFGAGGWGAALLKAALTTFALSVAGFLSGAVLGALAAFLRLSGDRFARGAAFAYSALFRGVPDLLTIYLLYFGGSVGLTMVGRWFGAQGFIGLPAFTTGVVALAVISGAYQAEVYRGAFLAIHRGELDAARAYGMSGSTMLRRIVAPQVLRYAIPGLGNVWQLVLKDSALVSVIGLVELMREAQVGAGSTREPFVFFCSAAALYLAIAMITGSLFRHVERRSLRGVRTA
ncbi:MAG: ABC transporter permease subunit [Roseiarcus sp.]|jgi:octopine/nopaline transport system permease protein